MLKHKERAKVIAKILLVLKKYQVKKLIKYNKHLKLLNPAIGKDIITSQRVLNHIPIEVVII